MNAGTPNPDAATANPSVRAHGRGRPFTFLVAGALWTAALLAPAIPGYGQEADFEIPRRLVTGSELRVDTNLGNTYQGELLAVGSDSLWLSLAGTPTSLPLDALNDVRVKRHDMGWNKVGAWLGIAAVATTIGMTVACGQVEDTSCGGVAASMLITWGVVGGLGAWGIASTQYEAIPPSPEVLRPYARYPQGKVW